MVQKGTAMVTCNMLCLGNVMISFRYIYMLQASEIPEAPIIWYSEQCAIYQEHWQHYHAKGRYVQSIARDKSA